MSHYGDDGEKVIQCIVHGLDKAGKPICNVDHARDWALGSSHPLAIKIVEEKHAKGPDGKPVANHLSGIARDVSQSTPAARRLRALPSPVRTGQPARSPRPQYGAEAEARSPAARYSPVRGGGVASWDAMSADDRWALTSGPDRNIAVQRAVENEAEEQSKLRQLVAEKNAFVNAQSYTLAAAIAKQVAAQQAAVDDARARREKAQAGAVENAWCKKFVAAEIARLGGEEQAATARGDFGAAADAQRQGAALRAMATESAVVAHAKAAQAQWRLAHPVASAREDPALERAEWDAEVRAQEKKREKDSASGLPGSVDHSRVHGAPDEAEAAQRLLGEACAAGNLVGVRRACARGANPNARSFKESGALHRAGFCTAVFVAARHGRVHVLRFLLAATGADADKDDGGSTGMAAPSNSGKASPCWAACFRRRHDCVRVLLSLGAAPDHCTYAGGAYACSCPADVPRVRALNAAAADASSDGGGSKASRAEAAAARREENAWRRDKAARRTIARNEGEQRQRAEEARAEAAAEKEAAHAAFVRERRQERVLSDRRVRMGKEDTNARAPPKPVMVVEEEEKGKK